MKQWRAWSHEFDSMCVLRQTASAVAIGFGRFLNGWKPRQPRYQKNSLMSS